RRRRRRRPAALPLPLALALARRLRGRLPRRRGARAVRDVDRHVALGARAARARDPGRQPAERRRLRVRLVRRDGAAARSVARFRGARGEGPGPNPPRTADGSYGIQGATMPVVLAVALGGALGASARFGLDRLIDPPVAFPWSTFVVNISGCFLIG